MTLTKLILLKKAASNITRDVCFRNRWIPLTTIEKAMKIRYDFNESCPLWRVTLSKALGSIDTAIDDLSHKNPSVFYRAKMSNQMVFYIQDANTPPPSFINPKKDQSMWDVIIRDDTHMFENYKRRILRKNEHSRTKKKKP